jgi:hypothetical protein
LAEPLQTLSGPPSAVPLVPPVTRVSASHISMMPHAFKPETANGWEPAYRLPPIEYCIAQQTPLGEWPLVAAKCEARGSCTGRHQV